MLLRFKSEDSKEWWGVFAFGDFRLSGVFASPHPHRACVMSKGAGYWVNVDIPSESTKIDVLHPIRDVRIAVQMMLFVDFCHIAAFGADGLLWKKYVCWDETED
jgi:hypothetical protein